MIWISNVVFREPRTPPTTRPRPPPHPDIARDLRRSPLRQACRKPRPSSTSAGRPASLPAGHPEGAVLYFVDSQQPEPCPVRSRPDGHHRAEPALSRTATAAGRHSGLSAGAASVRPADLQWKGARDQRAALPPPRRHRALGCASPLPGVEPDIQIPQHGRAAAAAAGPVTRVPARCGSPGRGVARRPRSPAECRSGESAFDPPSRGPSIRSRDRWVMLSPGPGRAGDARSPSEVSARAYPGTPEPL